MTLSAGVVSTHARPRMSLRRPSVPGCQAGWLVGLDEGCRRWRLRISGMHRTAAVSSRVVIPPAVSTVDAPTAVASGPAMSMPTGARP